MAAIKTVFDFLECVPHAISHEEIYREKVKTAASGIPEDVDLNIWEIETVGVGERNLLRDLMVADKFHYPGMDVKMEIMSGSTAKKKTKVFGKGNLTNERTYAETYLMPETIQLDPIVMLVTRPGLQVPRDGALPGIAAGSLISPSISVLDERMVFKEDLRHLFLKGYLILMAYNLSILSDTRDCEYNDIQVNIKKGVTGPDKLAALGSYPIVVDVDHFTREEIWLLAEMADEYPCCRYGDLNIYNNIQLGGDMLVFISEDEEFDLGKNPGKGSPERLWHDLMNIAIKFGALDDLKEVIRDFRGVPGILRSVNKYTGRQLFIIHYPRSYSVKLGVIPAGHRYPLVTRNSGYYATSKCLVADLMLSKMLEMSAFNIIEELGVFSLGCPTGDPVTDVFFKSNLRWYGLKHVTEQSNYLLQEWNGSRGSPINVSFGGCLMEYVQKIAAVVRAGDVGDLRPQLLYALPFSACKNTTWSVIRGWKSQKYPLSDSLESKVENNQRVKAFTWVMGVSDTIPKVGLNSKGCRFVEHLSNNESKFECFASGDYDLGMVRHSVATELMPRMDVFEMGMTAFYSTSFPGTRCTIVYDSDGERVMVNEPKVDDRILASK